MFLKHQVYKHVYQYKTNQQKQQSKVYAHKINTVVKDYKKQTKTETKTQETISSNQGVFDFDLSKLPAA